MDFDCEEIGFLSFIRENASKTPSEVPERGILKKFLHILQAKMSKKIIQMDREQSESHEVAISRIRKILGDRCACCVLITCSEPTSEGKMEVEMSFEGEESLAAFLIENASQVFDERVSKRESK